MVLTASYIISQLVVIGAYIIYGIGFLGKSKVGMIAKSIVYNALMIAQYILLGATSGIIASSVNVARNAYFIYAYKKEKGTKVVIVLSVILTIVLTMITYESWIDILPLMFSLIAVVAYGEKKIGTKFLRCLNIASSIFYIIYAICIQSWTVVPLEFYVILTTIIGWVKHERNDKK